MRSEPRTLQDVVERLPAFGRRKAVGLREDLGLRWWSYARLHRAAHRAAAQLRQAGIGKGDRVLLRGRNSPEWVAWFFGVLLRGAVAVPLDFDAPPELVKRIAGIAQAKALIAGEPDDTTLPVFDLDAVERHPDAPHDVVPVTPDDPAIVFFTSGTTSDPRGVVLTHGNVVAQIAGFGRWRGIARWMPVRILVMAPASHAQGMIVGVAVPLSLGASVIYTAHTHPGHLIRVLRDNRVLLFSTVPRVLHVLARAFLSQRYGKGPETLGDKLAKARRWMMRRHFTFTHMRRWIGYTPWVVLVGGAPLPREDEDFWRVSGCLLVQGYGLTESSAIVSVNLPLLGTFGSVGKPVGGQEIRLADDGEILVRGSNISPDAVADGFLHTGDLGRVDRRNRLFVLGRKKEVIVTGEGFNVHAGDVEAALNASPGVEDSVVFGLNRRGHMEVHAALLMRNGGEAGQAVARANQQLLSHQRIQSWTVWPDEDFPRTSLMKPRRALIAESIASRTAEPVVDAPVSIEQAMQIEDKQKRLAALARCILAGDGSSHALVQDLGLSSLDTIELLALLERRAGRVLDNVALAPETTVAELQSIVRDPAARPASPLHRANAPRWPELGAVNALRRVLNPLVLDTMVRLRARLEVSGLEHLAGLEPPVVFAGGGHARGFDVLLVYASLPRPLRRKMAVVTSRWVFTSFFERSGTLARRLTVGFGYHVVVPLFFPFILSAPFIRARETLMEACRVIDRGYSVLAFEARGMAAVARQCGVPIVPVRLANSIELGAGGGFAPRLARPRVSVAFDEPLDPSLSEEQLVETLDRLYAR